MRDSLNGAGNDAGVRSDGGGVDRYAARATPGEHPRLGRLKGASDVSGWRSILGAVVPPDTPGIIRTTDTGWRVVIGPWRCLRHLNGAVDLADP